MARPIVDISGIERQQRIASLALIPVTANATWRRTAGAGETNLIGEPESAETMEWPVSVFEARYRAGRGRWKAEGRQDDGRQQFLVTLPEGVDAETVGWTPRTGDDLVAGGVTWRVVDVTRQPNETREYWEVDGERLNCHGN